MAHPPSMSASRPTTTIATIAEFGHREDDVGGSTIESYRPLESICPNLFARFLPGELGGGSPAPLPALDGADEMLPVDLIGIPVLSQGRQGCLPQDA